MNDSICERPGCNNILVRKKAGPRKRFCSPTCQVWCWRNGGPRVPRVIRNERCYCTEPLVDGKCPFDCPPEADPEWLARQDAARAAREAHARREERVDITAADVKRVRRALAKFDPEYRKNAAHSSRVMRAAYRSHAAGCRR